MKSLCFKGRLHLVFNSVLTILPVNPPDLSLPRFMSAGRVAGITQGESVRVSDLDAAPEPNANSAEVRFFRGAFGLDFGRPCVAGRVKLCCTRLNF